MEGSEYAEYTSLFREQLHSIDVPEHVAQALKIEIFPAPPAGPELSRRVLLKVRDDQARLRDLLDKGIAGIKLRGVSCELSFTCDVRNKRSRSNEGTGQEHVEEEIHPVIKKSIIRRIGEVGGKLHIEQFKEEFPMFKNKNSLIEKRIHV